MGSRCGLAHPGASCQTLDGVAGQEKVGNLPLSICEAQHFFVIRCQSSHSRSGVFNRHESCSAMRY